MVKYFQSVIGTEARRQILEKAGRLPDVAVACVGGGSNAIGLFSGFEKDDSVAFVGVEAAGRGLDTPEHCATLEKGRPGVLHGAYTYLLQDDEGRLSETYSISAGLDYPGVGPEHSMMKDSGRAKYVSATDDEAVNACLTLSRTEGIIPALESSHALAYAFKLAPTLGKDKIILVNVSGRGDKDTDLLMKVLQ
jgi:tryptophan synthase beta chain